MKTPKADQADWIRQVYDALRDAQTLNHIIAHTHPSNRRHVMRAYRALRDNGFSIRNLI